MATAIPVINDVPEDVNTSAEAPAKASFWARAKARIVDVAKRIASPVATAGRKTGQVVVKAVRATKLAALRLWAAIKRTAAKVVAKVRGTKSAVPAQSRLWKARRATTTFFAKAKTWVSDTWKRVVRPFLKIRAIAFAVIAGIVCLVVAPLTTLTIVFLIGFALWALSYGVEHLESSSSPTARRALKVVEFIAQGLKALVFAAAALITIILCVGSVVFALTEVLELVLRYFNVKQAVGISTAVYFLLTGNWLLFTVTVLWNLPRQEVLRRRSVDNQSVKAERPNGRVSQEPVVKGWDKVETAGGSVPHADEPRAFVFDDEASGVRRVKLPKCTSCGVDDGGSRYGLGRHRGICIKCFTAFVESDLLEAVRRGKVTKADIEFAEKHGVKVPAAARRALNMQPVSQLVTLTVEQLKQTSAVLNSAEDPTKVYWVESQWWHDGRGVPHTREWIGVVAGNSIAAVEYSHDRKNRGFTAWRLGQNKDEDVKLGMFDKLETAKGVIVDALSDQAILIGGMLDGLRQEAPPPVIETEVLQFVEANEFESPEAHIEHVRKTKGDKAAAELEEQYLQEMVEKEAKP